MNRQRRGFMRWRGLKGPSGSHHFPASAPNLAASPALTVEAEGEAGEAEKRRLPQLGLPPQGGAHWAAPVAVLPPLPPLPLLLLLAAAPEAALQRWRRRVGAKRRVGTS